MRQIRPWVIGPIELLRHGQGHLHNGSDFDKRMALISFDNAIEVAISTYLNLHPEQRSGLSLEKQKVLDWSRNFHEKLKFLEHHVVVHLNASMRFARNDIVFYHKLRNELYHGHNGYVPDLEHVLGSREVALWVVSVLFDMDAKDYVLGKQAAAPVRLGEFQVVSEEFELLHLIKKLHKALTDLSVDDKDDQLLDSNLSSVYHQFVKDSATFSQEYEDAIQEAEVIQSEIVDGVNTIENTELRSLVDTLQQMNRDIEARLRVYQKSAVHRAVDATITAIESNEQEIGVVTHPIGSGITTTLIGYTTRILQEPAIYPVSIVVLVDRLALLEQLHIQFSQYASLGTLLTRVTHIEEFKVHLKHQQQVVALSTVQRLFTSNSLLSERSNIIVIGFQVSPGTSKRLRHVLPNAYYLDFTNTPLAALKGEQGKVIHSYSLQSAITDGFLNPPTIEYQSVPDFSRIAQEWMEELDEDHVNASLWQKMDSAFTSPDHIDQLAERIVTHFEARQRIYSGNGLITVSSHDAATKLYDAIVRIRPSWHGEFADKGVLKVVTSQTNSLDYLAHRFSNPDDPFLLAITVDLWLVGLDVPQLHTLYIARPLKGVALAQAVTRIMRHPQPVVVDYVGLSEQLSQALGLYHE